MNMKHLILISVVILLSGCAEFLEIESEHPTTYNWMGDGQGSYSKLQTDRYECAQEASGDDEIVYVFVFTQGGTVSGTGATRVNGSLFRSCLGARNWQRNRSGTGIGVAP
tara:strand:+ start:400 stop:729 length:330 start_codon:yes stop_codon:yes gene_type:complete